MQKSDDLPRIKTIYEHFLDPVLFGVDVRGLAVGTFTAICLVRFYFLPDVHIPI